MGPPEFEAATENIALLDRSSPEWAFGNVPAAREMAERFNLLITSMQAMAFTGGDPNAISLVDGKFSTHCEYRENQVVFLVHVPQMKNYRDEVRHALLTIAWLCAREVTERNCPDCRLGVGLRGEFFYGAIATGPRGDTSPTRETGAVLATDALHGFFSGPAGTPVEPMPSLAPAAPAEATLADKLRIDDRTQLFETVIELEETDADISGVVPQLKALAQGYRDERVRAASIRMLVKLEGEEMAPTLEAILRNTPGNWNLTLTTTVDALLELGEPGGVVLNRQYVESPHTRRHIVTRLEKTQTNDEMFIPLLRLGAADPNHAIRKSSLNLLGALKDEESVPVFIDALEARAGSSEASREAAARALSGLGPNAKAAVPALTRMIETDEGWVLRSAANALQSIGPDAAEAIPALKARAESFEWFRPIAEETIAAIERR